MILTQLVIFEFIPGAGDDGAGGAGVEKIISLVTGMGPMGKTRVHPHPLFNRVKH